MHPNLPIFALPWLAAASFITSAESLTNREDIRQQTGAFMDMIASGRTIAAYNSVRPVLAGHSDDHDNAAKEAATYLQQLRQSIGEPVGSSRVQTEIIADDFTRETWLQKFESAALAWQFTYYQASGNGWQLMEIRYSTNLDDLYRTSE